VVVNSFQKWRDLTIVLQNNKANPFDRAIYLYGAGLGPLYTYLISVALSPFRCLRQEDGSLTLVASPSLDCFDIRWRGNWASIGIGLLNVILVPSIFIYVLWKYRRDFFDNKEFLFRYGYLTTGLKRKYYWWNVFQLFRKTLLVTTIDLSNNLNTFLRMFLVIGVLLCSILLETLCQPRQESSMSRYFVYT
jgi:hypothetical protein